MSRRCGLWGPPAARGKQNNSTFWAASSCTQRPLCLFNVHKKAEFLNLQKHFFSLEPATLGCRMQQQISRCQQLSGGKQGPCPISRFPGWHGPSPRAPQQSGIIPRYLFPSFSQLMGATKNREAKTTLSHSKGCCWQTSVYFPPPATLY